MYKNCGTGEKFRLPQGQKWYNGFGQNCLLLQQVINEPLIIINCCSIRANTSCLLCWRSMVFYMRQSLVIS